MSSSWAPDRPASRLPQLQPGMDSVSFSSTTTPQPEDRSGAAESKPPPGTRKKQKTSKKKGHSLTSSHPERLFSPASASSMRLPRRPSRQSAKQPAIQRSSLFNTTASFLPL